MFLRWLTPYDDLQNYNKDPSLSNATSLILGGAALLPGIPSVGAVRKVGSAIKSSCDGFWELSKLKRMSKGADGAESMIVKELRNGRTNSITHQVTRNGKVIHQHQQHIGKYGSTKSFPDEWTGTKTIE